MKISVIIPTCQSEHFLGATLASILQQSRQPDELIVSDDGSTDETCLIIEDFVRRAPFPVCLLHHQPSGITNNYLNALQAATGDLILVGDHDDVWLHHRIREIERFFARSPETVLVSCDSAIADAKLNTLGDTIRGGAKKSARLSRQINQSDGFLSFLRGGLPLLAHTLSFRSSLKDTLLHQPKYIPAWWFEEWVACVGACRGKISFIPDALTLYRQHDAQTTRAIRKPADNGVTKSRAKYSNRIQKMAYCRVLISRWNRTFTPAPEAPGTKYVLLGEYIRFLQFRNSLRRNSTPTNALASICMLLTWKYHRFARGFLSFGSDMRTVFTSSPPP